MRTKIRNYSLIIISAFVFLFLVVACGKKSEGYRNIKIEILNGDVLVTRSEKEIEAYKDMKLQSGDNIKTSDESNVIFKLDDDKYIYIGDNSNIDLVAEKGKTNIRVNEGSIVSEVKNKISDYDKFEVEAPNSTMAIRGTTFGVKVIKTSTNYITSYRLVSGKIDLKVLDGKDENVTAGLFHMNPMQEIEITSTGSGILAGSDLTNAIENINDDNTNEYTDVNDYISQTHNVSLVYNQLKIEDIQDIIKVLPTNHDSNVNRVVALNSTFDVRSMNLFGQFVAESKQSFDIVVSPINKPNNPFSHWLINGEINDGPSILNLTVDKSMVIEAVYQYEEHDTTVNGTIYSAVKYKDVNSGLDYVSLDNSVNLSNGEYEFVVEETIPTDYPDYRFVGWVEVTPDGDNLPIKAITSTMSKYKFTVSKDVVIEPLFINTTDNNLTKLINRKAEDVSIAIADKGNVNWKDNYVVQTTTKNEIILTPLLLSSIIYDGTLHDVDVDTLSVHAAVAYVLSGTQTLNFEVYVSSNAKVKLANPEIEINYNYEYYNVSDPLNIEYLKLAYSNQENDLDLGTTSGIFRYSISVNSFSSEYLFMGFYRVDNNKFELLNQNLEGEIFIDEDMTIKPIFVSRSSIVNLSIKDNINHIDLVYGNEIDLNSITVLYETSDNKQYAADASKLNYNVYVFDTENNNYIDAALDDAISHITDGERNPYITFRFDELITDPVTINVYAPLNDVSSPFEIDINASTESYSDSIIFNTENGILDYHYENKGSLVDDSKDLYVYGVEGNSVTICVSPFTGVIDDKLFRLSFALPEEVETSLYNYKLYKYNYSSKSFKLITDPSNIELLYSNEALIMAANYIDVSKINDIYSYNNQVMGKSGMFVFSFGQAEYLFDVNFTNPVGNVSSIDIRAFTDEIDAKAYDAYAGILSEPDIVVYGNPYDVIVVNHGNDPLISLSISGDERREYIAYTGEGVLTKLGQEFDMEADQVVYLISANNTELSNIKTYSELSPYLEKSTDVIKLSYIIM